MSCWSKIFPQAWNKQAVGREERKRRKEEKGRKRY